MCFIDISVFVVLFAFTLVSACECKSVKKSALVVIYSIVVVAAVAVIVPK